MKTFAGCLLLLAMALMLSGCGSGFGATGATQIRLAIYTPLCMEVMAGSTAEGAIVQTYPCMDGAAWQQWTLTPVGTAGGYNIVNLNSKQCMSVSNADPGLSTPIVQAPCYTPVTPSQVWTFQPAPVTGYTPGFGYNIVSSLNKLCLDIPEGETVGSTQLQVYTCTSGDPAQGYLFRQASSSTP